MRTGASRWNERAKKSRGLLRPGGKQDPVAAFRFVAAEKANYPVTVMCCVLGVSKSGFYRG